MRITRANNKAIEYACNHFHYAKAVPVNTLGYNIYNQNDDWCGVILYGMGANKNIGTEYGLNQGQVYELVRVALNGKQECTSQAVAMTLKQIHKDCPLCRLIVSYADCDQNHLGTIYQATNWVYVGLKNENTRGGFIVNGKKTHPKSIYSIKIDGKHCPQTLDAIHKYIDLNATEYITKGKRKYLYALDKKMKKQIAKLSLPYPKIDADWQKIDRKMFDKKD
ncbi:MAG: protein Mom [Paludibacteraceae bacterium]|nr:protein Mom [Bacteroidales bacterium]MBQ5778846.1 protein Mom [Paludibacteraceae bacterium]